LAAAGKYSEAYELATQVLARDPSELRVSSLMPELSDDLSVSTKPVGAKVYLRRLGSGREERVGVTPINHLRAARAEYILSIRKAGGARCYIATLWNIGNQTATRAALAFYDSALSKGNALTAFSAMLRSINNGLYENIYILWGLHFTSLGHPATKSDAQGRRSRF